eukprot:15432082-Alexandrium_andersonii.AAC.1
MRQLASSSQQVQCYSRQVRASADSECHHVLASIAAAESLLVLWNLLCDQGVPALVLAPVRRSLLSA